VDASGVAAMVGANPTSGRHTAIEAAIRAAASDGWCCGVCGKRFAYTDVALAQACEARHAVESGRVAMSPHTLGMYPNGSISPGALGHLLGGGGGSGGEMPSPPNKMGTPGSGGGEWEDPTAAGVQGFASPAGFHRRGPTTNGLQPVPAAGHHRQGRGGDDPAMLASPWSPAKTLASPSPAIGSPGLGEAGLASPGRVYTSADARAAYDAGRRRGGGPTCTMPVPQSCVVQ
jgi:hypothetical protein